MSDDETGYLEYHRQMFPMTGTTSAFVRWKILSTGISISRQLAVIRNEARRAWADEHGVDVKRWPVPHPPAVLWFPEMAHAACLRCFWIDDRTDGEPSSAAASARRHAASYLADGHPALWRLLEPLPVWHRDDRYAGPALAD